MFLNSLETPQLLKMPFQKAGTEMNILSDEQIPFKSNLGAYAHHPILIKMMCPSSHGDAYVFMNRYSVPVNSIVTYNILCSDLDHSD